MHAHDNVCQTCELTRDWTCERTFAPLRSLQLEGLSVGDLLYWSLGDSGSLVFVLFFRALQSVYQKCVHGEAP